LLSLRGLSRAFPERASEAEAGGSSLRDIRHQTNFNYFQHIILTMKKSLFLLLIVNIIFGDVSAFISPDDFIVNI